MKQMPDPTRHADSPNAAEAPCDLLAWDSDFFGFPVARVRGAELTDVMLRRIDDWCATRQVRLLYFFARPDDPATIAAASVGGFLLTDVRVTYRHDFASLLTDPTQNVEVRRAAPQDGKILEQMTGGLFRDSRFYHDPRIAIAKSDELFRRWVSRSLSDETGVVLIVTQPNGSVGGFVTCHLPQPQGRASIGLLGVAPAARGTGLGRALVFGALRWAAERGAAGVEVVTQVRNIASQRLYQRCGFLIGEARLVYHKWYGVAEPTPPAASAENRPAHSGGMEIS